MKIINLLVLGALMTALCMATFQLGRRSLSADEIADKYDEFRTTGFGTIGHPYKSGNPRELYLDLMKLSLGDMIFGNPGPHALTMISLERMDNLQYCVEDVINNDIPGDLIEAGAWRGGACIFMRAILKVRGITDRTVWVADSFEGLPEVGRLDAKHWSRGDMAVSLEEATRNFQRFNLLDGQVRFLKGWFKDTLPGAPIHQLAVLRLDADLYESTRDSLVLYPKLSPGGYIIIDDWKYPGCRKAVEEYRQANGIAEPVKIIDEYGAYWQKKSN